MKPNWIRYLPPFIRAKLSSADAQKVVGNTGWLLADKLIKAGGELTIGLWMARYLGPKDFGLLSYAIAFVSLFSAIAPIGLQHLVVRDLVRHPESHSEILGTATILRTISGVALAITAILTIIHLQPNNKQIHWIVGAVSITLILQTSDVLSYWFQFKMQAHSEAAASSTAYLTSNILRIALIFKGTALHSFANLLWIEALIKTVGLYIAYIKSGGLVKSWKFKIGRAKSLLSASWRLTISSMAIVIYARIDQIMLGQMVDPGAVGIYTVAVKFSEAWYFIPVVIAKTTFPVLLNAKQDNSKKYSSYLSKLFRITIGIAYCIVIPTVLFSNSLINHLLGSTYSSASSVLSIHILAGIFAAPNVVCQMHLTANNLLTILFINNIMGAIANVLLNYTLIPMYGEIGAAIATLISYFFTCLLSYSFYKETRNLAKLMARSFLFL